ncbi:MAG: hypothetical protein WDO13_02485 [Verrucomicrobiota bacterium]
MNTLLPFLVQFAGALQLLIAAANFFLPGMLRYRESLAVVAPIIRQIFLVHAAYIVLVLGGLGLVCLAFARDLCGTSPLGRSIAAFLAVFWLLRAALQFFYYDRAVKETHPLGNFIFGFMFVYLASVFTAITIFAL